MAILVIAALVILGPERLPSAMSWVAKTLKQAREYATGAQNQFKEELGPEFEDLKKPFEELRGMRGMTPRGVITKHLLDGDDSLFTGNFDAKPQKPQTQQQPASPESAGSGPAAQADTGSQGDQTPSTALPGVGTEPAPGTDAAASEQRPAVRFDSEAT